MHVRALRLMGLPQPGQTRFFFNSRQRGQTRWPLDGLNSLPHVAHVFFLPIYHPGRRANRHSSVTRASRGRHVTLKFPLAAAEFAFELGVAEQDGRRAAVGAGAAQGGLAQAAQKRIHFGLGERVARTDG
jgi:hypothetical protein